MSIVHVFHHDGDGGSGCSGALLGLFILVMLLKGC